MRSGLLEQRQSDNNLLGPTICRSVLQTNVKDREASNIRSGFERPGDSNSVIFTYLESS